MIQYDSREEQSPNGLKRILSIRETKTNLVCEHLQTGDYMITLDGINVPIETATYSELIQSLNKGRKQDQLARCREYPESWLIYEGSDHRDLQTIMRLVSHQRAGTLVLQSLGPYFTGKLIARLYAYYRNPNHGKSLKQRNYLDDSPELSPQESALTAASGIGSVVAKSLIEHAQTINWLCMYDFDELSQIPNVGPEKAKQIFKLLHHEVIG